jgi:hypothetical protein
VTVEHSSDIGDRLSIRDEGRQVLWKVDAGDTFLGMFQTSGGTNLTTLWVGGTSYRMRVLRADARGVRETLNTQSRSMPELVNCGDDEAVVIVSYWDWTTHGDTRVKEPTSAVLYRWQGNEYAESAPTPWSARFALACPSAQSAP